MKKVLMCALFVGVTATSQAQEAEGQKFQAGLTVGTGMTFNKMGTSRLQKNGVGSVFSIGATVNYGLTNTIGLSTGLEFDFESLKYKTGNENVYYNYNDKRIIQAEDNQWADSSIFRLATRKQKPIYLTIPTMLTFRTKFIGYFRYFGKFGLRSSFLLSNSNVDEGYKGLISNESIKLEGMKAEKDMLFFKSSVGLSGGAEWNFTGTTSLVAEIGYFYGFINLYRNHESNVGHQNENKPRPTLYNIDSSGNAKFFSNSVTQGQFRFKVSVLF